MIRFQLPVAPVVFHFEAGLPFMRQSCPMFVPKLGGVKTASPTAESGDAVPFSQFMLKQLRQSEADRVSAYLQHEALPLAVRCHVIPEDTTLDDVLEWPQVEEEGCDLETVDGRKHYAKVYLFSTTMNLRALIDQHNAKRSVDLGQLNLMACLNAQQGCLAGLLVAIASDANRHAARGARGRKKFGDETRELVRQAAQPLVGKISKERAALQIAKLVNREPPTVRRLLIELYPGKKWKVPESAKSTDSDG